VQGKVEFEATEEGREAEILEHLLRRAVADTFRHRLGGVDLGPLVARFADGSIVESGELVPAADLLASVGRVEGLARILAAAGIDDVDSPGLAASGVEFALEGLYLLRRLSKETVDDKTLYGAR
jgi:magnesium chelatase subunit I